MRRSNHLWLIVAWVISPALQLALFAQPAPPPAQSFRISGTVVSSLTGQPLGHADIQIGVAASADASQRVITNDDGHFEFSGLSPGKYWLRGSRGGYTRQGFDEHEGYFTAIAVGAGLNSEGLIFRLRPDASISGAIVDEQNEAVRDAQVSLFRDGIAEGRRKIIFVAQANSDDQGRYKFSGLRPGSYYVAVSARPWYAEMAQERRFRFRGGMQQGADDNPDNEPNPAFNLAYPLTYYSSVTDPRSATPVVVKADDRANADIALAPVHALSLRIHDPDISQGGQFSANVEQILFQGRALPVPQDVRTRNGEIDITGLAPGEFSLRVQTFGNEGRQSKSWSMPVTLTGDADVSVPGAASFPITGVVTVGGMAPGRAGYIQLRDRASGNSCSGQISAKGDFEIPAAEVRPGTYDITVGGAAGSIVSVSATGAKVIGQSIVVNGTTPVRLSVSMSQNLATIDGIALREQAPVAGAMIVLVPSDPEKNYALFRRDQSDSDGTFSLREILPGNYTLVAIENGWDLEWANPSLIRGYLSDGTKVEVASGRKYRIQAKVKSANAH